MDLEQLSTLVKIPQQRLQAGLRVALRGGLIVGLGYVGASVTSDFVAYQILSSGMQSIGQSSTIRYATASLEFQRPNYHELRRSIEGRNLFNETGEFPDESSPNQDQSSSSTSQFDINAKCEKSSLNLELLGTIYMESLTGEGGESGSLATIKEKGFDQADIYKEGDQIIDHEGASIARIERQRVIINNNGVKECLELTVGGSKPSDSGFPSVASSSSASGEFGQSAPAPEGGDGDCILEEKYVQDQLGAGFGTIIQKARLVPNTTDNVMNGFKIFAIDKTSLLGRIGLENGDIITQVNDVSLKQPEQGFALYNAFQDEREVVIHIMRGTTPRTITCRIR